MADFNVIPTLIASRQERRAGEEANYIAQRRKVQDPLVDLQNQRVSDARGAMIERDGVMAGDPTSYGQIEGIKRSNELHPAAVRQAGLTADTTEQNLTNDREDRARAAGSRMLAGIANSGAKTVEEVASYLQAIPPEVLAQSGTDPAKIPQLIETLKGFPDVQEGVRALRHAMGTPERMKQIVTGLGPDGKPVNQAIGEDQAPGALSVTPDDRDRDLNNEVKRAQIRASDALAVDRLRGPAPKAGASSPAEEAATANALFSTITDMRNQLNEAAREGAIPSDKTDGITNAMTGDNPVGRWLGGLTGDRKETLRRTIDDTATMLLTSLINSPGMSSRLFDSNAEKETWRAMLGGGGSFESRWSAIDKFDRFAQARLSDPARQARAAATGGGDVAQAPAAGAQAAGVPLSANAQQFFGTD